MPWQSCDLSRICGFGWVLVFICVDEICEYHKKPKRVSLSCCKSRLMFLYRNTRILSHERISSARQAIIIYHQNTHTIDRPTRIQKKIKSTKFVSHKTFVWSRNQSWTGEINDGIQLTKRVNWKFVWKWIVWIVKNRDNLQSICANPDQRQKRYHCFIVKKIKTICGLANTTVHNRISNKILNCIEFGETLPMWFDTVVFCSQLF